jgi:microcompartment protein CcmK/EutM
MKFGKVIGRVVSTVKVESFEGLRFSLIQPTDEHLNALGDPIIAVDTLSADIGQIICYETSKEASMVLDRMNPCDAAIVSIVDEINLIE